MNHQIELAKKLLESKGYTVEEAKSEIPHTESYKGYTLQSYNDFGCTIYKDGKKIREFEDNDEARDYIDNLN